MNAGSRTSAYSSTDSAGTPSWITRRAMSKIGPVAMNRIVKMAMPNTKGEASSRKMYRSRIGIIRLKREAFSEIVFSGNGIIGDLPGAACNKYSPLVDDVCAVGDAQRLAHVVI